MRSLISLLFFLAPSFAAAAEIDHEPLGDGIELIAISGDLKPGDDDKFKKLAVQYSKAIVFLSSDGGALLPSLEIGKAIHLKEYTTVVADNRICTSACALIWIAGANRLLTQTAKVGFHASYLETNGRQVETGVGNALVGRYLTQLELPERAIIFATSAPPVLDSLVARKR